MQKKHRSYTEIFLISITCLFLFGSCEKRQTFVLPTPSPVQAPTEAIITSIELINCNFEDCISADPDLKPDLYIKYNYTVGSWFTSSYHYTSVLPDISQAQMPQSFAWADSYGVDFSSSAKTNIYVYDLDTGSPTSGTSNFLGGVSLNTSYVMSYDLLESHAIGESSVYYYFSSDNKLAFKLNLLYK